MSVKFIISIQRYDKSEQSDEMKVSSSVGPQQVLRGAKKINRERKEEGRRKMEKVEALS